EPLVITMTHSENIKTFDDLSCHLEHEFERLEVAKLSKDSNPGSAYVANNQCWPRVANHKNQAPRSDSCNGLRPKKAKTTLAREANAVKIIRMANDTTVIRRDTSLVIALSRDSRATEYITRD
ncbi:hypothetical protein TorRG33x02_337040, partial [Trema orientale]